MCNIVNTHINVCVRALLVRGGSVVLAAVAVVLSFLNDRPDLRTASISIVSHLHGPTVRFGDADFPGVVAR